MILKSWKFKKATKRTLLLLLFILTILISGYHHDGVNSFFRKHINSRSVAYLNIDLYRYINQTAHKLDFKGKVLSLTNPVNQSDIINLKIDNEQMDSLIIRKKKWIDINVQIDNTFLPAKLKFHGTSKYHYINGKYSFRVKMKSTAFDGMRIFNLIKAEEADPTIIAVNKIAKEMGLLASSGKMITLRINDKNSGAYYLVERISEDFLFREFSIKNYAKLANVTDWTRKENIRGPKHISDLDLYAGHIKKDDSPFHPLAVGKYKKMCEQIDLCNSKELIKYFDIEYMGKYLALLSLFNDIHHVTGDNLKLIYDIKSNKFFPIYRQESGSRPLSRKIYRQEDVNFINFTNYNKLVFSKSIPNYNHSTNSALLKLLISNDLIRNSRDRQLNEMINNKSNLIQLMKNTYQDNSSVIYSSSLSRRSQYFREKQQLKVFSSISNYAKEYIDYGHIYGSINLSDSTINLIPDCYSQVRISSKENLFEDYLINGISLDCNLKTIYNSITIPIKLEKFNLEDIIFINNLTQDTISTNHIHINMILES